MAAVAPDRLGPFLRQALHRDGPELVGIGHLAPHQQTKDVAPVQETRVLQLLVNADPVETEVLDQLDFPAQCLVARSGQE